MKRKLLFTIVALLCSISTWAGTDCTSKMSNAKANWTNASASYGGDGVGVERYNGDTTPFSTGDVLYQTITGLDNGYYEVSFYAWENYADHQTAAIDTGRVAQVFANSAVEGIYVAKNKGGRSWDAKNTYTLLAEVTEGILKYGIKNTASGGNWAVCKAISLTYLGTSLEKNTDITSALANPSFENVYEYKNTNTYINYAGWTDESSTADKFAVQNNKSFSLLSGDYFAERYWWANTSEINQTTQTLPSGFYRIIAAAKDNAGTPTFKLYAKAGSNEEVTQDVGADQDYTIEVYQASSGSIKIGFKGTHTHEQWVAVDNFRLTYLGDPKAELTTLQGTIDGSYLNNATYTNVGGSERTTLTSAKTLAADSETAAAYETAISSVQAAIDAFVAAKTNYDKFVSEKTSAIAIGVTTEAANAVTMTSASGLDNALHALYALEDAAATSGYAVNATTLFGTWSKQNMDEISGEHWSDDASISYFDKWNASGYTSSVTSTVTLPAGKYVFKVAARAEKNSINGAFNMSVKVGTSEAVYKDFVAQGNSGKGIDTSGSVNYGSGTFANSNNGRGWEWRFIGFELDASASVTMKAYAQILGGNWVSFSDATLLTTSDNVAILKNLLNDEITAANAIYASGANVGTGVFQYPSSAASTFNTAINTTAQGVYDDEDATSSTVSDAIDALKAAEETYIGSINPPANGKRYCIKVAKTGHAKYDNALVVALGSIGANNPTGYTISASDAPAAYLNQAFILTQVSGNTYNISIERPEGTVYLTYGSLNGSAAGWNKSQIQCTTNSSNKGAFKIVATTTDNVFKIYNTECDEFIDCQSGGNFYTDTNISDELFTLEEASQASVAMGIIAGKYATRIFPFAPSLPSGVVAYSCAAHNGALLTLEVVDEPQANVPYILLNTNGSEVTGSLTGWGTAKQDTYNEGYLTGVYTAASVEAGNYVLQTQGGVQGFYKVTDDALEAIPYRAYLTVPAEIKAFFFDVTDGINNLDANDNINKNEAIYNLAGQRVQKAQKGLYIVNGRKVVVK